MASDVKKNGLKDLNLNTFNLRDKYIYNLDFLL